MKLLIFITVFLQEDAVRTLFLLLESLILFGHLDESIDILIYTTPEFQQMIVSSNLYIPSKMFFHNPTYDINTLNLACKARMDLFDIPIVCLYSKILYLDIDILIKGPIRKVFDMITKDDLLYTLEEGNIDDGSHAHILYKESGGNKQLRTAFTSGIMGFTPSPKIRLFFENVRNHFQRDRRQFCTHDQPFIVFHAFMMDLYDNQILKLEAINRPTNIDSPYTIYHYCGGIGRFKNKREWMTNDLSFLKNKVVLVKEHQVRSVIDDQLIDIVKQIREPLEGNLFMEHNRLGYSDKFKTKRQNIVGLFSLMTTYTNVLEIGFNSGFSALLILMTNPNVQLTCIDICQHKYVIPCFKFLKNMFGSRIQLIQGNSVDVLPTLTETYDIIHIDGGIDDIAVENDCRCAMRLSRKGSIIIMDDYDFTNIHKIWDQYCKHFSLQPLSSHVFTTTMQDIRIKI